MSSSVIQGQDEGEMLHSFAHSTLIATKVHPKHKIISLGAILTMFSHAKQTLDSAIVIAH